MTQTRQIEPIPQLTGYEPGKDWSPHVPQHLVDEETGKDIGTVPGKKVGDQD